MKQATWLVVAAAAAAGGCAANTPPMAVDSTEGSLVAPPHEASPGAPAPAPLNWARLEAAVIEAGKDAKRRVPPDRVRAAAIAYAKDINRIAVEDMKQYHVDRATLVLEREVFSGETLAEGAALRARVTGGGGGGSTRGSRNSSTGGSRGSGSRTGSGGTGGGGGGSN
jgi:hypothetical protein